MTHRIYGVAQTINSANYVYFMAQMELSKLPNSNALFIIFNEELLNLHRGQGLELFWRDTMTVPTMNDYLQMISNKTGGLFRLGSRLLQCLGSGQADLTRLANILGLIYQIRDDYKNLMSDDVSTIFPPHSFLCFQCSRWDMLLIYCSDDIGQRVCRRFDRGQVLLSHCALATQCGQ